MSRYLARAIAAFVAIILVVLIVPIALLSTRLARSELRERADRQAAVIATAVTSVNATASDDTVARIVRMAQLPGERTVIADTNGTVLEDSDPTRPPPPLPDLDAVLRGEPLPDGPDGGPRAAAAIVGDDATVAGLVTVTMSPDLIADRTRDVGVALLAIGAAVVAAAAGFGAFLARSLVRPVEELDIQAGALAAGDLKARVKVPSGPAELRRLGESFNDMASQLDAMVSSQRAFVSDAAHQLRTPLTVLRLRLEALEDRSPDDDVVALAAEVSRMRRMIDDLLALTRLERRQASTVISLLGAVVREHCELWSALADEHGLVLRTRVTGDGPPARVLPGAVEHVLDNFLENAVRVAPAGSEVVVTVAREGASAVVRVADRGPGLSDEERHRAFDRFWRGSNAAADGGTGLGLAIVARLVAASGGHARLENRAGGGTIAIAEFPLGDEPPD